jgi:hypothetical protein
LISALTGTVTHGSDTWLVDSGASKDMTDYKDSLTELVEKDSPHKVKLGDDYHYPIKGVDKASYILESSSKSFKDHNSFRHCIVEKCTTIL